VTSSSAAPIGQIADMPASWSHAPASQCAASAAGKVPPTTKPKKRPPAVAVVAGEPISSSTARTVEGSVGPSGSGSSKTASRPRASGDTATPRVSRPAR